MYFSLFLRVRFFFYKWTNSLKPIQNAISLHLISFFLVFHSIVLFYYNILFCMNKNISHWNCDLENMYRIFFYLHLHHFILSGHHIGSTILNLAILISDSCDPKNLGIPSCTRIYQMEINLGMKGLMLLTLPVKILGQLFNNIQYLIRLFIHCNR